MGVVLRVGRWRNGIGGTPPRVSVPSRNSRYAQFSKKRKRVDIFKHIWYIKAMNDLSTEVLSKSERALARRVEKLDKAGVTDERLFRKVLDGLEAGEEEEVLRDGVILKVIKPNLLLQHKWTETALRMKGHLMAVEIKNEVNVDNRRHNIVVTPEDGARLLAIASTLERLNNVLNSGVGQSGEVIDVCSAEINNA